MKVKDVCARNAQLKLSLTAVTSRPQLAAGRKDISAILPKDSTPVQDEGAILDQVQVGDPVHTDEDEPRIVEANNSFLSDNGFVE